MGKQGKQQPKHQNKGKMAQKVRPFKSSKVKKQAKPQVKLNKKTKHKWGEARAKMLAKIVKNEEKEDEILTLEESSPSKKLKKHPKSKSATNSEGKESLRERMTKRLEAARFRQINEELDSTTRNSDPLAAFESDPDLFKKYHEAYRERVEHWPKNPLNQIIKWTKKKLGKDKIIADFGCGEAVLASSIPNKVHSFDLFALNERVTACDMSKVPLEDESVDAAVFCLSLMGTDVSKFIGEANRVLKINGLLKIAEVASRFSGNTHSSFLKRIKKFGFIVKQGGQGQMQKKAEQDQDEVFLMFEFRKVKTVKSILERLPALKLNPSVYKKR